MVEKQAKFLELLCRFILTLTERGYKVTAGEIWRSPEQAALYKAQGKGIANSLHCLRLAADLNLFKDGELLGRCEEAGVLWESMSEGEYVCCWGGRFTKQDCDHYSLMHQGIK